MKKQLTLGIFFFFLFLFILSQKSYAYETFNYNPDFTTDYTGINILDISSNATFAGCNAFNPFTWGTCIWTWLTGNNYVEGSTFECFDVTSNTTGYLILNPSTSCTWVGYEYSYTNIIVKPLETSDYYKSYNTSDLQENGQFTDTINLPANQEGIIWIKYFINDTTDINTAESYVYWTSGGDSSIWNINTTAGNWIEKSIFIPPSTIDRTTMIFLQVKYNGVNTPKQILIDRFEFYTLDILETRLSWSSNWTTEALRYCGPDNIINPCGVDQPVYNYFLTERDGLTGSNICFNKDTFFVGIFKLGNITIARRITNVEVQNGIAGCGNCGYDLWVMNDMYFFRNVEGGSSPPVNCPYTTSWLAESHALTNAKISVIRNGTLGNAPYDEYDSSPASYNYWYNTFNNVGYNALREYIALNTSANPSGDGWRYRLGSQYSSYYPFFTSSINCVNEAGLKCSPSSNMQYLLLGDCSTPADSFLDCGYWGCNAEETACAWGTVGNECLDQYTWQTTHVNGTVEVGSCFPANCYIINDGINCLAESEYNATISTLQLQAGTIDMAGLAEVFGSGIGWGGLAGRYIVGFIIMIAVMFSVNIGPNYVAHKDFHLPKELNILFVVALAMILSLIGLWDPIIIVAIILFGIGLVISKIIPSIVHRGE